VNTLQTGKMILTIFHKLIKKYIYIKKAYAYGFCTLHSSEIITAFYVLCHLSQCQCRLTWPFSIGFVLLVDAPLFFTPSGIGCSLLVFDVVAGDCCRLSIAMAILVRKFNKELPKVLKRDEFQR
jgi:hypothetical protein